jgi:myosin heavy subunit
MYIYIHIYIYVYINIYTYIHILQGIDSGVLPPHIYAVADAAYRDMMRVIMNNNSTGAVNQTILISGE